MSDRRSRSLGRYNVDWNLEAIHECCMMPGCVNLDHTCCTKKTYAGCQRPCITKRSLSADNKVKVLGCEPPNATQVEESVTNAGEKHLQFTIGTAICKSKDRPSQSKCCTTYTKSQMVKKSPSFPKNTYIAIRQPGQTQIHAVLIKNVRKCPKDGYSVKYRCRYIKTIVHKNKATRHTPRLSRNRKKTVRLLPNVDAPKTDHSQDALSRHKESEVNSTICTATKHRFSRNKVHTEWPRLAAKQRLIPVVNKIEPSLGEASTPNSADIVNDKPQEDSTSTMCNSRWPFSHRGKYCCYSTNKYPVSKRTLEIHATVPEKNYIPNINCMFYSKTDNIKSSKFNSHNTRPEDLQSILIHTGIQSQINKLMKVICKTLDKEVTDGIISENPACDTKAKIPKPNWRQRGHYCNW